MQTRQFRKQSFSWQEKKVSRLIKKNYKGRDLGKMLLLFFTLTWIDSDFNGKPIKHYTKTISTYSGLSVKFIPGGLRQLKALNIIEINELLTKEGYKKERVIELTPNKIRENPKTQKGDISVRVSGDAQQIGKILAAQNLSTNP